MDFTTFSATHVCHSLKSFGQVGDSMAKATRNQLTPLVPQIEATPAPITADPDENLMKGLSPFEVFRRERIAYFMRAT